MKKRIRLLGFILPCAALVLGALPATTAQAQDAGDAGPLVQVQVSVLQEVTRTDEEGKTIVESRPVGLVSPGDVLSYTLRAENNGDTPAYDARIEDPIPAGTLLITDSVASSDSQVTASIDGGESWRSFPVFVIAGTDDQGQPVYEQAAAESYTHLRWLLDGPLPPGAAKEVSFKVQVR